MTALLDVTSEWFTNIDDGLLDSAIYLDPTKAFDTVDHNFYQRNVRISETTLECMV